MAMGPFQQYAPPGVYTSTTVDSTVSPLLGGIRIPVLIGVAKESMSQSNVEMIRGSSSFADTPIFGEDVSGRWVSGGSISNPVLGNQDGTKNRFKVRNSPIVDGAGSGTVTYDVTKVSVTVDGEQVVASAVDGQNGYVTLLVPPSADALVSVTYYFHRKDTRITDDVTDQVSVGQATLIAPKAEGYDVTTGTNDTFVLYVNDNSSSSTVTLSSGTGRTALSVANEINLTGVSGLTAAVHVDANGQSHLQLSASGNIQIGTGSANGILGFTAGDYTNRTKSFRVFQGPIVDGSDGGITTTDPSKVTVLVDGAQVLAKAVDGSNRLVTLYTAPRAGQRVTIGYWFNTFQDTFDYLPNNSIISVGNVGMSPGRRDYVNGADFVISNKGDQSKIQWGTIFRVEAGVKTGNTYFDSTQVTGLLVDDRMYGAACERYTDPVTAVVSATTFVLPEIATTGNGRSTTLSTTTFNSVTNGRIELPTNRPDLVEVHVGTSWRDASSRQPVTVVEVDAASNTITLKNPIAADQNVYATFWYNRITDDKFTLTVVNSGVSGIGTYTVSSSTLGTNLLNVKFGTKNSLPETVQWPSGTEYLPDAYYSGSGTPIPEIVTVAFSSALNPATHASVTSRGQEPYNIYNYTRVFGGVVVDGTPAISVDLSLPYKAVLVGKEVSSAVSTLATDRLVLKIDGVTLSAIDMSSASTVALAATAINAAVDADIQTHADSTNTFASTAPNNLASVVSIGSKSILTIRGRNTKSFTNGLTSNVSVLVPTTSGQTDYSSKVGLTAGASVSGSYNAINQVATLIGSVAGPFSISAGVNDTVQLNVDGSDIAVTIPSGSVTSTTDVVTAINDAYIAVASSADIATYTSEVVTLANTIRSGYNTHRVSTVFHASADTTNVVSLSAASNFTEAMILLNDIKAKFNAHLSQSGVHSLNDTSNTVVVADATNLQTAVRLANVLKDAFNTHLSQFGVHGHNDTVNTLVALPTLTISSDCYPVLNDLKAKYNLHRVASGVHLTNDTVNTVVSADATDDTSAFTLSNELKVKFNLHLLQAGIHIVNDVTNDITSANATDATTLIALTTELWGGYEGHRTQTQGAYDVHGTNDTVNSVATSMTELVAHAGVGEYADKIILTSRVNNDSSNLTVKSAGTANETIGFTPGVSAQRKQPTALNIATAINANSSFAAIAVAYRVQAAGLGGYLRIDSRTTGSTSTLSFTNVANTALTTDTGLGITPGSTVDVGENAQAGFTVSSSAGSAGSSGVGFPGQTYTDSNTGLRFTVLPAAVGDYSDGGSFTLVTGQTVVADASIPVRMIPGLEMLVYNTYNMNPGTTAILTTFPKSGFEPKVGDVYYVSYEYAKNDLSTKIYRENSKIVQSFGEATPDNPLSLAARLAQLNGAVLVGLKQVLRTPGLPTASAQAYITAIDELRKPIDGLVKPDVIVPLSTDTQVFSYLNQHSIFMGSPRQQGERMGVVGVASGTSPLGVQSIAKSLNSELMVLAYPDSFITTIQDTQGNQTDVLIDGPYAAAAIAGAMVNPAYDVATPLTHRQIVGIKKLARVLDPTEANQIATAGVMVLEQIDGGLRIRHALTTNPSSVITRTPSVTMTIHHVQQETRSSCDPYIGAKLTGSLIKSIRDTVNSQFGRLMDEKIVSKLVGGPDVTVDANDPTIIRVQAIYIPVFPLEYIMVSFTVRVRA